MHQLTKDDAAEILARYDDSVPIGSLYDDEPNVREALGVLIPGFEYPDWDGRTLADVLQRHRRGGFTLPRRTAPGRLALPWP